MAKRELVAEIEALRRRIEALEKQTPRDLIEHHYHYYPPPQPHYVPYYAPTIITWATPASTSAITFTGVTGG